RSDGVTVYASTQGPNTTRDFVAQALGRSAADVNVFPTYLGGGFGRKTGIRASVEAAILSQACGCPVHVGWNRTEEMQHGYHRPPARNRVSALLDDTGTIIAMEHDIASGDIMYGSGTVPAVEFVSAVLGADPLALSQLTYAIPNRRVRYHRKSLPIPTGPWRGLGTFPNTFAVESFMDELADAAGIDPLTMRLKHLPDDEFGERMRRVLETVTDAAGWTEAPTTGAHYGLACGELGGTLVAMIVAVSVEGSRYRVEHVWCAIDPGLVVNPDGARAQAEGTIVMALGSVMHERLTVENGIVNATNFGNYPLTTIRDVPDIEVMFVESNDHPVGGLGEPVIGVVPAAVANALYVATGQRLRDVPFRLT
ncbi:MAG: molybdopterin cofactor-binding domain-containing protein, partial [Chloroflexota bacterium]